MKKDWMDILEVLKSIGNPPFYGRSYLWTYLIKKGWGKEKSSGYKI